MIEPLGILVAKEWLKVYARHPLVTLIFSILVIIGLIGMGVNLNRRHKEVEEARRATASYARQIDSLNNVEANLKNLIEFVEIEKKRLNDSEKLLNDLKNQEQLLKPIVEADRRTVESLLELQNRRAQESLSRERWIGFGLGVLASLVASIIYGVVRYLIEYRKRKPVVTPSP